MTNITVGFALTGSFCTFEAVFPQIKNLTDKGIKVIPIMSDNAYRIDTRFGKAEDFAKGLEKITGNKLIHSIFDAEPIGPQKLFDILIIAPCTGNTLAKISTGIADTPVTLAVKSHLRNNRPLLLGISTNDALSAAAKNIGLLHNRKNVYFIPYTQDDSKNKPNSIVADFTKTFDAMTEALEGRQIQPVLL